MLLTRTGTPESAHRGITALFVDMDSPGITPRPIETMHGEPEFCEVFFDDVLVPFDRTIGGEGDGVGVRDGPAAVRAQHLAVATRRVPARPLAGQRPHWPYAGSPP